MRSAAGGACTSTLFTKTLIISELTSVLLYYKVTVNVVSGKHVVSDMLEFNHSKVPHLISNVLLMCMLVLAYLCDILVSIIKFYDKRS